MTRVIEIEFSLIRTYIANFWSKSKNVCNAVKWSKGWH